MNFEEEQQKIFEDYKDEHMFEVPIICNLKLVKMRYLSYRQIINIIETKASKFKQDPTKAREDFIVACFCAGLDQLVEKLSQRMVGDIMKKFLDGEMDK